jgi:tetratricopeptide (TPR) repeat protein
MDRLEFHDLPDDVREALEMIDIPGQDEAECINTLQDIAELYPGFVPARLNLAAMQLQAGDPDAAEATYRSVLSDFPNENGAIGGIATVLAEREDYENAEQQARHALELGYEWAPLYEVIAKAREHAGDAQSASAAYLQGYRLSPHSWDYLEQYCRLNDRQFISPMETVAQPVSDEALKTLFAYIDESAHTPDQNGEMPGCDHTFRFTEEWAQSNGVDIIELYQFLNAHGGFCDCEVCFNVEASLFEDELDDEELDDEEIDDEE